MTAYYNEIDTFAAAWLRELIKAGHIADGVVDERSIEDVTPDDLREFTQCHFFAGIGVWSYALRQAGWPDDRPVWTGSCPCQPFSAAGKGGGFADERHLWPSWDWLIEQCRPPIIVGEQVASKDAEPWLDLVQSDLEGMDYAFGAVAFPSAGIGAPHIRDRTYWVADTADAGRQRGRAGKTGDGRDPSRSEPERLLDAGGLGGASGARLEGQRGGHQAALGQRQGSVRSVAEAGQSGRLGHTERLGAGRDTGAGAGAEGRHRSGHVGDDAGPSGASAGGLADADGGHPGAERQQRGGEQRQLAQDGGPVLDGATGPINGLWRAADWLLCRDGKWRPVEPGTFPLAHGAPARVGRLRGFGNAINAIAAQTFIEAYLEGVI